jgi:hypothetical protein
VPPPCRATAVTPAAAGAAGECRRCRSCSAVGQQQFQRQLRSVRPSFAPVEAAVTCPGCCPATSGHSYAGAHDGSAGSDVSGSCRGGCCCNRHPGSPCDFNGQQQQQQQQQQRQRRRGWPEEQQQLAASMRLALCQSAGCAGQHRPACE